MAGTRNSEVKLAFLGGGNMAEALVRGLIEKKNHEPGELMVTDVLPKRLEYLRDEFGVSVSPSNADAVRGAGAVVLAVKPAQVKPLLQELRSELRGKLVISIAAGVSLTALQNSAPEARFVRVMPNTPSLVGAGMSVFCAGAGISAVDRRAVELMFGAVGRAVEVSAEHLMDAVTGLSGSGPAFVFLFIEALADGGVQAGLPRALALELAVQTVLGSALLVQETAKHPGELKDMVTSPGGTTIAGLAVLEDAAFRGAVLRAVQAAAARSKELGQS